MQVTSHSRRRVLAQNLLSTLLVLVVAGLLAWLSNQYVYRADWTYGHRNSLSPASVKLLEALKEPLTVTAYARAESPFRDALKRFIRNYETVKPDVALTFVDPDREPEAARRAGITRDGQVVLQYAGRSEKLEQVTEAEMGDALQRLARSSERYVVFLSGDGERSPTGEHNFDLGDFGKQLEAKGFKVQSLNLAANPGVPQNTSVLVIAGPQAQVVPGMVRIIRDYVKRGGNLLWLGDPGPLYGFEPLASDLGLHFGAGTLVDPDTQLFGIDDPKVIMVPKYPAESAVAHGLSTITAFPDVTSVSVDKAKGWEEDPFLQSLPRSWLESGKLAGSVAYDPKTDTLGPLTIGLALTRMVGDHEQRVMITGDGDFLSNQYLGTAGNLDLGLDMFNWASHDDAFIDINPRPAPDLTLGLTPTAQGMIGLVFLFLLPVLFLSAGLGVWLRRRRR
ncbi:MAG TPA: GldG family protein [Gammaproteobacteria bacterium]|jgi:hypothetical protein|nr:GldG family protein [Gammaproteobacteria bacterium]